MFVPPSTFLKLMRLWSAWTLSWNIVFKRQAWRVSPGKRLWEIHLMPPQVLLPVNSSLDANWELRNLTHSTHWALYWCYSASFCPRAPVSSQNIHSHQMMCSKAICVKTRRQTASDVYSCEKGSQNSVYLVQRWGEKEFFVVALVIFIRF